MKRRKESGFAMLLVFVLAAAIAISLYMEMPRVAFESQRQREHLLISRGMQYERGIQLYYRKYHTYPQNLDDLETTKNMRFLRRRYKDPMTGKDEWRLIHVGPGGQLTDSLVQPANPQQSDKDKDKTTADSSQPQNGAAGTGGPAIDPATGQPVNPGLNMAMRRPSDRPSEPVRSNRRSPDSDPNQPQPQPQYPVQQPGQPQYPVQPGQPGQPDPSQPIGQPQYPVQPGQPQYPGQPGSRNIQGNPGSHNILVRRGSLRIHCRRLREALPARGIQYNRDSIIPVSRIRISRSIRVSRCNSHSNRGASAPQLRDAKPGHQPHQLHSDYAAPASIELRFARRGTGLAGVASTAKGVGIHIINDRKKYQEWEFIYDIKNDKTTGVGQMMQQQQNMVQGALGHNRTADSAPSIAESNADAITDAAYQSPNQ